MDAARERGRRTKDYEAELRTAAGESRSVPIAAGILELAGQECVLGLAPDITAHETDEAATISTITTGLVRESLAG